MKKKKLVADGFYKGNSFSTLFFSLIFLLLSPLKSKLGSGGWHNISDKVVTVQARTKTSWRLLTYDTQTLSSTSTISNNSGIWMTSSLHLSKFMVKKEKYQNHTKAQYSIYIWESRKDTKKKILQNDWPKCHARINTGKYKQDFWDNWEIIIKLM